MVRELNHMCQQNGSPEELHELLAEFLGNNFFNLMQQETELKDSGIEPTDKERLLGGVLRHIVANRENKEEIGHGVFERRGQEDIVVWRRQSQSWLKPNFLEGRKFSRSYMMDKFDRWSGPLILESLLISQEDNPEENLERLNTADCYEFWEDNPELFFDGFNAIGSTEMEESGEEKEIERLIAGFVWEMSKDKADLNDIFIGRGGLPHNHEGNSVRCFGDFDVIVYNESNKNLLHVECTLGKPAEGESNNDKVKNFVNTHNHLGNYLRKNDREGIANNIHSIFFAPYFGKNHGMVRRLGLLDGGDSNLHFVEGELPSDAKEFSDLIGRDELDEVLEEHLDRLRGSIVNLLFDV